MLVSSMIAMQYNSLGTIVIARNIAPLFTLVIESFFRIPMQVRAPHVAPVPLAHLTRQHSAPWPRRAPAVHTAPPARRADQPRDRRVARDNRGWCGRLPPQQRADYRNRARSHLPQHALRRPRTPHAAPLDGAGAVAAPACSRPLHGQLPASTADASHRTASSPPLSTSASRTRRTPWTSASQE